MRNIKKFSRISLFCLTILSVVAGNHLDGTDQDFFHAVGSGDLAKVNSMIMENPCVVHREDQWGRTAIFHAIMRKNREMVRLLIKNGSLIRIGDRNLRAPIHYAGFMNDIPLVQLLLDNGAVIDTRAIGAATPLIHSALADRVKLSQFLVNNGADINIQCNSLTTPLYFAVLNHNMDLLKFLVDKGADIDTPDFLDRTPLYIAVRDGYVEMVNLLIDQGADYQKKDKLWKRSMLHLAAIHGYEKVAEILIDKGVDINVKDGKAYTPMDYAHRYGHGALARILRQRGGRAGIVENAVLKEKISSNNLTHGQARLIKLQNGSWGIMTRNRFLLFGYSELGRPPADPSLLNGAITLNEMKNKHVVYLDLDFHPGTAKYSLQGGNPIYAMQHQLKHLSFILNLNYRRSYQSLKLKNAHFPKLKETMEFSGAKVTAVPSYMYNMGYFLECDGLRIFWLSAVSDSYITSKKDLRAIEYAAENFPEIDILILGTPSGIGPERGNTARVAYLEIQRLKPRSVFFMGKPPLERRIRYQIGRRINHPDNVHCSENPGDRFFYSRGKITSEYKH